MEDNTNVNTESKAVDSTIETTNNEVATETKEEVKTFTQEEMDKIIAKRLAKEKQKAEAEKQEAERLAKLSAEERQKAEFEIEKAKFEEERKTYLREKLELQVVKELTAKNLPAEFSSYLIKEDAESCFEEIKTFEKAWKSALDKAVTERLKGKTPTTSTPKTQGLTKDEFKKLSISEMQKLYSEDRATFEQLSK